MRVRLPSRATPIRSGRQHGFTLIEVMIAVAIVGVLAMVALPSMMDSIRKSRRADAFAAISAIQQAQERWRGNNGAYSSSLTAIGISTPAASNYDLTTSGTASSYTVTAVGRTGTSQANDQCRKLSTQMQSGSISYAGCSTCTTFTYAATDPCWSR